MHLPAAKRKKSIANSILFRGDNVFRKIIPFAVISLLFILSLSAASRTVYVDVDGPNDPGSGTLEDPFRRIQDAIDIAVDGDIVEIQPGLYTGSGNYDLDPGGKSIAIRSINDPNAPSETIVDPGGSGRGFYFQSGEDPNCILDGLTIRNGHALDNSGGGIYCASSNPFITRCIIENNTADLYGAGIYCYNASPVFSGCTIQNNQTDYDGGGLEISGGRPEFVRCVIVKNHATGFGGGVDFFYRSSPILINCVIADNEASIGGGINGIDSYLTLDNSILWGNHANQGGQLAIDVLSYSSSAVVRYSDLQGGQTAVYDPNHVLIWASGNISGDPCFVSFDSNGNSETYDFHLQSVYGRWDRNIRAWVADANTSPCIDGGDPNSDWSGEPWPNGKRINMGIYGGTAQASKNGNPADFNVDNIVDLTDLFAMSEQWLIGQQCIEDLNADKDVNYDDFVIFAENWLWERP
jgi:parallel beta-helix repeat protein